MNKLFIRLLQTRGFSPAFLHPNYEDLSDPFILKDMNKAIQRIEGAIKAQEKILIYGDYDVDGITASTVMEQALRLAGVKKEHIAIMLPNRFADGYGMSLELIKKAQDQGATLVITVDCGSSNHAIIDELNTLHIDTIVTDHHQTPIDLPAALAIINPHRKDAPTESLQCLAGVGVAFKLAEALVQKGLIKNGQEKWLLDLVLIGTICDSMVLTGENRILCYYGFKVLAKTRRPGLRELARLAGIKELTTDSVGFQIGPRLNAAGRLESAHFSLDLLRAESAIAAAPLASKLEQLNKQRKNTQLLTVREINERGISKDPVIIEAGKWHEGIIGIVAGRLVEEHHRPAFVLAELANGTYKGSGRSFGDFNLAAALDYAKDVIIKGGGHTAAAGVTIEQKNLPAFCTKINEYYRSLHLADQEKYFKSHADLTLTDFADLTPEFLTDLKSLQPFGLGNEEPIFCLKDARIANVTRMGTEQNHLRIDLKDKSGRPLKSVAFFAPKDWLQLDPAYDQIEPLVTITENNFNGVRSLEARLVDLHFLNR